MALTEPAVTLLLSSPPALAFCSCISFRRKLLPSHEDWT
jgi:hypothetical protein